MLETGAPPIGLRLTRTSRAVSRAFDETLAAAGGSLPLWAILRALKEQHGANQRQLAAAVEIRGATLTHHLDALEASGLVERRSDPTNRRIHQVVLTELGEAQFTRLLEAAIAFDQRLRRGLSEEEVGTLERLLDRLRANATGSEGGR